MKCEVTRERIIIVSGAVIGMVIGLLIMIPGAIMYFDEAPHFGFYYSVNLCAIDENRTNWGAPGNEYTTCEAFNQQNQTRFDPNEATQTISIQSTLLYPKYPYIASVYFPAGVTAKFQLAVELDGKQVALSGDIDTVKLESLTQEENSKKQLVVVDQNTNQFTYRGSSTSSSAFSSSSSSSTKSLSEKEEAKKPTVVREEVPIGDVKVKIFDVEGGEQVRIWKAANYDYLNGDFPSSTKTCAEQGHQGCEYVPWRSFKKYVIPSSDLTWSRDTNYPVNKTLLLISDVRIHDPSGNRGTVPEFWIEIDGEESESQTVGLVLLWIGALLLDCSPGVAYYFLTRIKSFKRVRHVQ